MLVCEEMRCEKLLLTPRVHSRIHPQPPYVEYDVRMEKRSVELYRRDGKGVSETHSLPISCGSLAVYTPYGGLVGEQGVKIYLESWSGEQLEFHDRIWEQIRYQNPRVVECEAVVFHSYHDQRLLIVSRQGDLWLEKPLSPESGSWGWYFLYPLGIAADVVTLTVLLFPGRL